MAAESSMHHLPPLINGRRYDHELQDPKSVPADIRADALELLHNYYAAVCLNERTLSEASATTAPARSEASAGTSITDMTFAFSANNGSVQPETARKNSPMFSGPGRPWCGSLKHAWKIAENAKSR